MASSAANSILLRSLTPLYKTAKGKAATTIKPGYMLERISDGTVQPHATAGGAHAAILVAFENEWIGHDINTAWDIANEVTFLVGKPGDEVQMRLAASATAVVIGDKVESNGDGCVRKLVPQTVSESGTATDTIVTGRIVGTVLAAVDNSAGATEVFVQVELA